MKIISLQSLLKRRLIKEQHFSFKQILDNLDRAKKDLKTAKSTLHIDEECAYNYAYLSMLRCGRAFMFLHGLRPIDGQQHYTTILFASKKLGKEFKELTERFNRMRRRRNEFTYDPRIPVSEIEAKEALKVANQFVDKIIKIVQKKNPQMKLV